jgi:F-box and WD-40 domain protein CDC4
MSELEGSGNQRIRTFPPSFPDTYTPRSGLSQNDSFDEVESPSDVISQDLFASAVATPPIADSDLEPLESMNEPFSYGSGQRPTLNTSAAQNASLPSPGLSPAYHGEDSDDITAEDDYLDDESPATQSGDSQETVDDGALVSQARALQSFESESGISTPLTSRNMPSVMESRSMLEAFDSMPNDMKSFMMYQFLRRCSKKTLHMIADVVNPALKCDFIGQLPPELSLHIISFLDRRDLCRAAQVSKQWRNVIDSNESGWKELFDRDGYVLPLGELEKAIKQGWGWQDPYGPEDYERDLSVPDNFSSSELDLSILGRVYKPEIETVRKSRSRKRKGNPFATGSDRAKRRAVGHEFTEKANDMLARYPFTAKFDKSEGPLTAANAAALAVPDPGDALECPPSLRKLHLFKSLYRRHYMLQRSWTSGKVAPHHFAFPAHPSHVITCLQFDDDKILTGSDDTLIHVYDTRTGVLRKKLEGHEGGVWALQYEGNVLVSGSTDRSVRVWDIEKGLCTQVFHGHTSTVRCLQILMPEPTGQIENGQAVMLPEKPLIITGSRDSQLRVWRLPEQGSKRYIQTGPPANDADCPYFVRVLAGHSHSVRAIAAHQDTLVSGSYDNTVRVWKISTGETVHRLQGHSMKVYSVVLDHKRNRCISGSMDNFVKIWSLDTGACLYTLEGHSSLVGLLDLRDERLVSAAADSTLRIWDPENGQCKSTLTAHTGAITCFQHDGQKVISGSDRTLKMWDVKTGECIKDLLTDLSGVWQVKFDERRCVAAVQRDNLTFVEVRISTFSEVSITNYSSRSSILVLHEMASQQRNANTEHFYADPEMRLA